MTDQQPGGADEAAGAPDGHAPDAHARVAVLAPSPLLTVTIEPSSGRGPEVHVHAGGQGVWVARMIRRLGGHATLCGVFGGEEGEVARHLAQREGIDIRAVEAASPNGSYVHDRRGGSRRVVVEVQSPPLNRHDLDDLYGIALTTGLEAGVCVLTGPMPHDLLPGDFYRRLTEDLTTNGARVVADLSAEALRSAVDGGLQAMKAAVHEFVDAGFASDDSEDSVVKGMRGLHQSGVGLVVVSRGDDALLAASEDGVHVVDFPQLEPQDTHGSGDSITAGIALGLAAGWGTERSLRMGTAAGTLNITRRGLGTGRRPDIDVLAGRTRVRPHEP